MADKGGGGGAGGSLGRGGGAAPSQRDSLSEQLFGGGPATVGYEPASEAKVKQNMRDIFGRELSQQELSDMVGAPSAATITMSATADNGLYFRTTHPDYSTPQVRQLYFNDDGDLEMLNDKFFTKDSFPPGAGTRVFAKQIQTLRAMGVSQVVTHAFRGSLSNGYYTWPRFGYDAPIERANFRGVKGLPPQFKGVRRVSDLMRTPEGRDFWKKHGDDTDMSFDLSPGSLSNRVLDAYTAERGVQL